MSVVEDVMAHVRLYIDEPAVSTKFTDANLVTFLKSAWAEVMRDINQVADNRIRVRYEFSTVANQQYYQLPPSIGQVLEVAKYNSSNSNNKDMRLWEVHPRNFLNPAGPGWTIEGTSLKMDPAPRGVETLQITYIPCGEVAPLYGDGASTEASVQVCPRSIAWTNLTVATKTVTDAGSTDSMYPWLVGEKITIDGSSYTVSGWTSLNEVTVSTAPGDGTGLTGSYAQAVTNESYVVFGDSTAAGSVIPTYGTLDSRPNAYAGYQLRLLVPATAYGDATTGALGFADGPNQDRTIIEHDPLRRLLKIQPALNPVVDASEAATQEDCGYEILPLYMHLCTEVLALKVAKKLAGVVADPKRMQNLNLLYHETVRAVRLTVGQMEQRFGKTFDRRIRGAH